jgi:Spy/CpxP family protein refolding chaperone
MTTDKQNHKTKEEVANIITTPGFQVEDSVKIEDIAQRMEKFRQGMIDLMTNVNITPESELAIPFQDKASVYFYGFMQEVGINHGIVLHDLKYKDSDLTTKARQRAKEIFDSLEGAEEVSQIVPPIIPLNEHPQESNPT